MAVGNGYNPYRLIRNAGTRRPSVNEVIKELDGTDSLSGSSAGTLGRTL